MIEAVLKLRVLAFPNRLQDLIEFISNQVKILPTVNSITDGL